MVEQGSMERVGRGLYTLPDTMMHEHSDLAEIATRAPNSVVCLVSALRFHDLTTQLPHEIWIAIEGTSWKPQIDYPPVNVFRFSGKAFHFGIETHEVNHVEVKVYSVAKTIADCFKFRNKIGLDIALEALRDALYQKRATINEIWQAAKVCRMTNVMRPYLEAIS